MISGRFRQSWSDHRGIPAIARRDNLTKRENLIQWVDLLHLVFSGALPG
jgi:hypothetical protein